ncbi:MAG TPA: HAMP domain-containing sensor histidine kinase [Gaiellaceae bacterium]|nr:HAMP domain-containing sensor histidine kinase [Gaiellaceae bacterium]
MFNSLRVRIPLLFLAGILLAGAVTTTIAVRLFQSFAHDRAVVELTHEANGIARLYANAVNDAFPREGEEPRRAPRFARKDLERATGDRIYYVGGVPFPGEESGLRELNPRKTPIDWTSGKSLTFEFTPPGAKRKFLAVANPVLLRGQVLGAIIVAQPKTDVRDQVFQLVRRLAVAAILGLLVAAIAAWYLARRLVKPLLALSRAADQVAAGSYDVDIGRSGPGEIGHLEERFGEMAQRLAEAEALERNFLMSVSHELRTPLTAIRGHVAALLEGVVEDPDLREHSLEIVEAEAQRLERLVGDILDLAKLDAHRFTVTTEEVDMETLLDRAYETFTEEARRRSIDYEREVRQRPVINSDGDRVLQIVGNLLSNAFKVTPDGGRIQLQLAQANGTVRVAVEDTGPGIPAEAQELLFRPFVSATGGGTGLGLAIAKELSSALGGRIDLESEVGRGSRFELILPAR